MTKVDGKEYDTATETKSTIKGCIPQVTATKFNDFSRLIW